MFCSKCGENLIDGTISCPKCGTNVNSNDKSLNINFSSAQLFSVGKWAALILGFIGTVFPFLTIVDKKRQYGEYYTLQIGLIVLIIISYIALIFGVTSILESKLTPARQKALWIAFGISLIIFPIFAPLFLVLALRVRAKR